MSFMFRLSLCFLALSMSLICPVFSLAQSSSSAPTNIARALAESDLPALVEKYFALYAGKDVDGLMSLWSQKSPDYASLKPNLQKEFASEDCSFSNPSISRIKVEGERASLRATINLTAINLKSNQKREQRMSRNFALVSEDGKWKVWRYAPAENDLAEALANAKTEAERAGLLAEEKELASAQLARALDSKGYRLYEQGDYPRAMALHRLARELAEQTGDRAGIARALNAIGRIHYGQGDYPSALARFQESLAMQESLGNKAGVARVLSNIGNFHSQQGDHDSALEYYQKSMALQEAQDNKAGIVILLNNIGNIHYDQSNYALALEHYQKSLKLAEDIGDQEGVAFALNSVGNIYLSQGNHAQALEYYRKGLALSETLGNKEGKAVTLDNIGYTLGEQGDYAQALDYLQKSLALREEMDGKEGVGRTLKNIGNIYYHQADYEQALEYYQRSLSLRDSLGEKNGISVSLNNVGKVHLKQGRHAQALEFTERAAALARQIGETEVLWRARLTSGSAYLALKEPTKAREAFEEAITTVETLRSGVAGGEGEQQRFFASRVSPYHAMADLLITQGKPAEALSFAERAKSRVLLDALQGGRVNVVKAMTAQEQEQERKLNSQLVALNIQISLEAARTQPDQNRLTDFKSQLQKARLDFEAFQTDLYAAHPALRAQRGAARPLRLEEAAALLPNAASALFEYVVTDEKTYLFAITKAAGKKDVDLSVYTLRVDRDELTRLTEDFRQQLAGRNLGFRDVAAKLYDLLLKPAEPQLRGKTNLIIVPDDKLWDLPFQALLTNSNRFLIENAAIAYAPSLTALREMMKRQKDRRDDKASGTLLALGNPLLGKETIQRATLALRDEKLDPLPEAEQEVKALSRLYGISRSKIYTGAGASEDRAKAEAGRAGILHFATHGILNNAAPMYSHLALAQGDVNEDGLLEAWELMRLDLKADLVVLSACETARGRFGAGEGVIGLTWAMFIAGAPATVVSQWKVESTSARDLMIDFHRRLRTPSRKPASKAEALRQAALRLMKNPQTSHPFYWAGFVLVGDSE
jgi:CHAT domain-containing protein/tetratricopeptide (TPR) repeat protein